MHTKVKQVIELLSLIPGKYKKTGSYTYQNVKNGLQLVIGKNYITKSPDNILLASYGDIKKQHVSKLYPFTENVYWFDLKQKKFVFIIDKSMVFEVHPGTLFND